MGCDLECAATEKVRAGLACTLAENYIRYRKPIQPGKADNFSVTLYEHLTMHHGDGAGPDTCQVMAEGLHPQPKPSFTLPVSKGGATP
jgi:hypothetical protein